jgi:hypothetical protein
MVIDDAGVTPNPCRDKHVRLPREEPEEINPPPAAHLESVYWLLPSRRRLALLWLDCESKLGRQPGTEIDEVAGVSGGREVFVRVEVGE